MWLNIINKQWDNKLVRNRGSALKQLKKLGVKLDKKWSAKLNEQKNKLTAEAETVQSSLNDQLKEAKDQTARSQKDAMERLKQTVQDWQSKLDAQAEASAIASNKLKSQVSSLKLQVIELKNQADEAKDKGVPLPSAKVEMDKLHEMRKQLQNVLKSILSSICSPNISKINTQQC